MISPLRVGFRPVRIFYGWWVITAGFVSQSLSNVLLTQAFGAYLVHLQAEFGWSKTALSGAFSLIQITGGVLGPLQGKLIDRFGTRRNMQVGFVILATGFVLLSFVNNLFAFYAVFLVLAIGNTLSNWVAMIVVAANWFQRRRAIAMGLVSAGANIAGLATPLVALSLNLFGWRQTALASGALVVLISIPATLIIRNRPEDCGLAPDGGPVRAAGLAGGNPPASQGPAAGESEDFTASEAARTPAFWLIGIGHALALLMVYAVNVHLIASLVERLGMSVQTASMMLAMMTGFCMVGQLAGGFIGGRVDKRLLSAAAMLGHVLGILALAFATNILWVVAFAALHGTAWGLRGPIMSAIRADYFGKKHLGSILGNSMLLLMVGQLGGPLLGGFLADRTGDYRLVFIITSLFGMVGFLAFVFLRQPVKPRRAAPAPAARGAGL